MLDRSPNLFLVGAMKAGTTSVASALAAHPEVFCCPIKEPNHFSAELHEAGINRLSAGTKSFDIRRYLKAERLEQRHFAYVEGREDYEQLFRDSKGQKYRLDASTTYFNSPVAAQLIHRYRPDARIIAILRDPVDRGWSEFNMNMRIGVCNNDPIAALQREAATIMAGEPQILERYVSTGFYDHHLSKFGVFPESQVLVLQFEDLKLDWHAQLARIWEFLGLEPFVVEPVRENEGGTIRYPGLNRFAHQTGLKYLLRDVLPEALVKNAKALITDRAGGGANRQAFEEEFVRIRDQVAHRFALPQAVVQP